MLETMAIMDLMDVITKFTVSDIRKCKTLNDATLSLNVSLCLAKRFC